MSISLETVQAPLSMTSDRKHRNCFFCTFKPMRITLSDGVRLRAFVSAGCSALKPVISPDSSDSIRKSRCLQIHLCASTYYTADFNDIIGGIHCLRRLQTGQSFLGCLGYTYIAYSPHILIHTIVGVPNYHYFLAHRFFKCCIFLDFQYRCATNLYNLVAPKTSQQKIIEFFSNLSLRYIN